MDLFTDSDAILKILSVDFCGKVKVNSDSSSKACVRISIFTTFWFSEVTEHVGQSLHFYEGFDHENILIYPGGEWEFYNIGQNPSSSIFMKLPIYIYYNAAQKLLRKTQRTASYLKPQAIENSFKRAYGEVEDNIIIYIKRLKT